MNKYTFCPHAECEYHENAPEGHEWYEYFDDYETKAFGRVPRYRCESCKRSFSSQTFRTEYYMKKVVDLKDLLNRHVSSMSTRAIGRAMGLSAGSVQNRIERLSRQGLAVHGRLRPRMRDTQDICIDGLVSFDQSQYFPNEITMSITAKSRYVIEMTHATRKRSGRMKREQKEKSKEVYEGVKLERGGVSRTFREQLDLLETLLPASRERPLVLITDEKPMYGQILWKHGITKGEHVVHHVKVNSRLPRTMSNPLFPSNYLEREIRKDQANHHREAVCYTRNVANGLARLSCYLVHHNYMKKYLIDAPGRDDRKHGEVAGIPRREMEREVLRMFEAREFLTKLGGVLSGPLEKIWRKEGKTPGKERVEYLPKFALG